MSTGSKDLDIILAEYKSLREEIVKKMDACWKILTFETGGISIVLGLVFKDGQYVLLPIIPFLILVSSFLHVGETSAIMNAGDYIREHIEVDLKKFLSTGSTSMSWEDFVKKRPRPYDLIHISTVCLFAGTFLASIILMILSKERIGISLANDWLFNLLLLGYLVAFVTYLYIWVKYIFKRLR